MDHAGQRPGRDDWPNAAEGADPIVVSGTVVEPDAGLPRPRPRPDGLALVGTLVAAIVARLDGLYGELLTAKDNQLAAKDDLIAELRRRVDRAEHDPTGRITFPSTDDVAQLRATNERQARELQRLRRRIEAAEAARRRGLAPDRHAAMGQPARTTSPVFPAHAHRKPLTAVLREREPAQWSDGDAVAPTNATAADGRRWRRHALIVGAAALIVLIGGATLAHALAPSSTPPPLAVQRPALIAPIVTVPVRAQRVLGMAIGLWRPLDAVPLRDGEFAVADTGNHRLAVVDSAGRLVRSEPSPGLQRPVAIAATHDALYVLDSGSGEIDRYDMSGRFAHRVMRATSLRRATGLAADARGGQLYLPCPTCHAILTMALTRQPILTAMDRLRTVVATPIGLAVAGRELFVLDAASRHIVELNARGAVSVVWQAPSCPAAIGCSLLVLPDRRLLVAGQSGAIFVYPPDSGLPVFKRALNLPGGGARVTGPLRLSRTSDGSILVIDVQGNRLLVIPPLPAIR